ncbi:UbiX family flavin prenyltransferase [Neisseria perflava]|uniref:UbiX family flavin prenyltransferase n=1 Tax=Neisseria perflava TaxID=33053 RepID=UPI0020A00810|nr:UbiX family flavin prenyltransferase [Neisseria perflava]MCP1661100.1 4-hydroxy-3-polyprenylbenzoate decarboxylase [Neisseria perflava]MCP1771479.1 4-hydroxy-3-polyprenylbenzoate decarboxylase [Neisseria perflava]
MNLCILSDICALRQFPKRRSATPPALPLFFWYGDAIKTVFSFELLNRVDDIETHLVVSKGAEMTRSLETDYSKEAVCDLADVVYPIGHLGAAISSGSFKTIGMLITPCSMRTLAAVAHGLSDNLLTRAADVVLKDRRRLVMMVRETPLNLAHIDNMKRVTEMGAIVFPPVPALYHRPQTVDEIVTHCVGRALNFFDIDIPRQPRWGNDGKSEIENV